MGVEVHYKGRGAKGLGNIKPRGLKPSKYYNNIS